MEVLLAIARCGSITAAADALGSTQPAVSQWLSEIEAALGVPLFVRGRQIRATAYLAPVRRHARRMVADSHALGDELRAVSVGATGCVRMGVMLAAAVELVPAAIVEMQSEPSGPHLQIVEDIAAGLWTRFERSELDILVGRLDERAFGGGLLQETLFDDLHAVVVRTGHPLARKRTLRWSDVRDCPWVLPPPETALRRALDASFLDHGLAPPRAWLESASTTVTEEVLRRTDAIGVLSGAAARRNQARRLLSALALRLSSNVGPIGMVWDAREPSLALVAVLDALRNAAKRMHE
ncbi:LysR substrate-binding domain-containing protein [Diaphorobacter caeni]|uniref:LysR substrate-binding domain-containing protein n=1 Tax=Diaphorobacter caeni TaxID=2784387 RepID=UPI00188F5162|nr:LysR substrate-binding domain-containing protein [Diaphorobacter caeni]MBF5004703.1 LysR family transcriptional regulator [Diaphorobacter caeni]